MLPGLPLVCRASKWKLSLWKSAQDRIYCQRHARQFLLGTVVHSLALKWTKAPSGTIIHTPVFNSAPAFGDKVAVIDGSGKYSYKQLYCSSLGLAGRINTALNSDFGSLEGNRISFMCANDSSYTVALWAAWMSGGTAVPLYQEHPLSELEDIISDSQTSLLVAGCSYAEILEPVAKRLGLPCLTLPPTAELCNLSDEDYQEKEIPITDWAGRPAMIVYTGGTTGTPKGVLHTFNSIQAMVQCLVSEWAWHSRDVILHAVPLNHLYGIVNKLLCPLSVGATCVMLPDFQPQQVWETLLGSKPPMVTVFMAMPTVYSELIRYYDQHYTENFVKEFIKVLYKDRIRLTVSGSDALPLAVLERWKKITGRNLLECYGLTEIGVALSSPLKGPHLPGAIGLPLPNVEVQIIRDLDTGFTPSVDNDQNTQQTEGQLLVRGPSVFKEYWNRPEETRQSFTADGWFKTGDRVVCIDGVYWLMGHTSVDGIQSGIHMVNTLKMEQSLLAHRDIRDVAVIGIPQMGSWGEDIIIAVQLENDQIVNLPKLKKWARDSVVPYNIPKILVQMDKLPRNHMGKINKKDLLLCIETGILSNHSPSGKKHKRRGNTKD
ncbi:malonate--CoA ligase ACSF3, mitochondrial isoform X2 [Antennarius striatus]|uniref:malonate--CoA ligase ACSF3, mitochondrial isoform X2 n=1 Tax=Antennarius striatus TaxID=241820 RepID=UPI0035AF59C1